MTRQQADLLQFIGRYQREHRGASPSCREMAAALGLKSHSGIHRLLARLEDGRDIERQPNRARSIRVVQPALTVSDFRAAVSRLVEQEGVARAVEALHDIAAELAPRIEGAA